MKTLLKIGSCALALLAAIPAARADSLYIYDYTTSAQFNAQFGVTTPTFNGIATPGGFVYEPTSLTVGNVKYDDQGNGELFLQGPGTGYDIGTGTPPNTNTLLVDEGPNVGPANINMTFASPVAGVGLIVGDPFGAGGDFALFNVTFGDGSSITGVIGQDNSLPITGGDPPNYFIIFDIGGNGISQLNFSDTAGFPTLDTVVTTPEPNSAWLLALPILALVFRKGKTVAARLGSGAGPLAFLASFALLAVPSFAQPTNCNLAVPSNPLTAAGLATPYLLSGPTGCTQASSTMAFVQAAIYNPAAHTISVYTPLVADAPPTTPGVPRTPRYVISPAAVTLPANAVVALWFGYNFDNLTLTGTGVATGNCFTGFGQFAACNTTAFWAAVNADTTLLTNIFAMGGHSGSDGLPCPTSRSFSIVDQDPNDNLPVSFLLTAETTPRTAQNTTANQAKFTSMFGALGTGWNIEINPSDEAVVDVFIDGALGTNCTPPMVADLTDPASPGHASLAVNELFAGLESGQFPLINSNSIYGGTNKLVGPGFVAIGDTFTLTPTFQQPLSTPNCVANVTTGSCSYPYTGGDLTAFNNYVAAMGYSGATSGTISGTLSCIPGTAFARTNQYRGAVNQPAADCTATTNAAGAAGDASAQTFCKQMFTRNGNDNSPADLLFRLDFPYFNQAGNGPGGSDLFMFLGNRFAASYDLLGCAAVFGEANPVNINNIAATTPGNPTPLSYYPAVFP